MREKIKIKLLQNLLDEVTKKYDEFIKNQQIKIDKTYKKSIKDSLTNLYNREYFLDLVEEKLHEIKDNNQAILIFLDLDNFKNINDFYGHKKGDEVLKNISILLKSFFREQDMVVRYGGDEFIIFAKISNRHISNIKNILDTFQKRIEKNFKKYNLSVSYGISIYPVDAKDIDSLIVLADKRMYKQKREKKLNF